MKATPSPRPGGGTRLNPSPTWSVLADAPLLGLTLAREAVRVLAWDEADQLILLDESGVREATCRLPAKVRAAAISDDGSLIVALIAGPRLVFLDGSLDTVADRPAPGGDPTTLAIDAHGRYVAVASKSSRTSLFTRYGTAAGSFEALHPLAQLRFVPDRPVLLAASSYGSLFAFDLEPDGSDGSLAVTERWRSHVLSSIGRLAITGDGGVILLSCYTHGLQRFDSEGRNEGTYHLDGTATLAVTDFAGKLVVAATTEGSLAILNPSGQVRWKAVLARGPVGLECDGLGQFVIYGLPSGEIVRLDLEASTAPTPRHEVADESDEGMTTGNLRAPKWRAAIARSDEQAETAVLAVLADPPRVIALTNRNRLQVFDEEGNDLGETPEVSGVGRVLRTAPGWVVAATDRHVLVLDAREGTARRLDLSLVELSHVGLRPADHGIVLIQEGDRIGRVSLAGRWVWKKELKSRVEDLALGSQAQTAVTNEAGELLVFDAAGAPSGRFAAEAPEPLALAAAPVGSPAGVCWITLARQAQVLRGHGADGRVIWESPVPWEAWQLHGLGSCVVVEAVDGRALAIEGSGHVIGRGRAESSGSLFHAGPDGSPRRLTVQGENLVVTDLDGRVRWRAIAGAEIGPRAAAANGVAVLLGRDLAWYPDTP